MTDLLTRLQRYGESEPRDRGGRALCREAYDEIERLEDRIEMQKGIVLLHVENERRLSAALDSALAELHHHFGCDAECQKRHVDGPNS